MKNTNHKKGFTLIELLVVISIIGLLSSVVLAGLQSAREKSKLTRIVSDLKQISLALAMYMDDHNNEYPGFDSNWGDDFEKNWSAPYLSWPRSPLPGVFGGYYHLEDFRCSLEDPDVPSRVTISIGLPSKFHVILDRMIDDGDINTGLVFSFPYQDDRIEYSNIEQVEYSEEEFNLNCG